MIRRLAFVLLTLVTLNGLAIAHETEPPAFPGAEGFGALTVGGRGGLVIEVTNLNDGGPGSLRAAIEAEGVRTVIFKVAGTISLLDSLVITNPYITIAGQTAPGDGITLRNDPKNTHATLSIQTQQVIIRYLRVRSGPSDQPACCLDAVQIYGAQHVILDHLSISWGTDGVLDITDSDSITVQWTIIAEALRDSTHEEGPHSMGSLVDTDGTVSLHHNLYVHNNERNPRVGGANPLDFVNNVVYDPGSWPMVISTTSGLSYVNSVNNYLKQGPSTPADDVFPIAILADSQFPLGVYVTGNYFEGRDYANDKDSSAVRPENRDLIVDERYDAPPITTTSAEDAYEQVLAAVGATLPVRDAVDVRLLDEVINGTGSLIDHPNEVGGWPKLDSGQPYVDSDHDGMSDEFEAQQGFDPQDSADGVLDTDDDGYTNLEEFLNSIG